MRILMISPYLPWPLYGGGPVRIFNILKELSHRGHRIALLAGQGDKLLEPDNILNSFCEEIYLYNLPVQSSFSFFLRSFFSPQPYPALRFLSNSLRKNFSHLLNNRTFDLIWVNFLIMLDTLSLPAIKNIPLVLDQIESDELLWQEYIRNGNFFQKVFAYLNLKKVKRIEKKLFKYVDVILCVSEIENNFTKSRAPQGTEVWTVPNGVDTKFFNPTRLFSKKETNSILLCSSFGVQRNIDAAIWFTKKIFPKIQEQIPDAEFWIIGSYPTSEIRQLNLISGVHVTGTVNEIRDYYLKGKVFVAPYRFGAGTKLKVLEAMAMGLPIVATEVGCQGIDVINGQHLLIANTETEFSERVIELLGNPQLAQKLAAAGRALVEQKYNWKKIVGDLKPKLQKLIYARQK